MVITAYNAEQFLAETLECVLGQGEENWTAVVADDASTDGTLAIARSFAARDSRITALELPRNLGVVRARNAAIEASPNTELIALLDHDDYWRPHYLERSLALCEAGRAAGRRVGIAASNAFFHDEDGPSEETVADRFGWTDPIDYDSMLRKNYVFARAVFSRAAFEQAGGFAPETEGADDYDLWLRIMELGYEVVSTREPLAHYRVHSGGMSRRRVLMTEAHLRTYRRTIDRGRLSPNQLKVVRARMRHYRALRERARFYEAVKARRPLRALVLGLAAAPHGAVAFLQRPGRWREWLGGLLRPFRAKA